MRKITLFILCIALTASTAYAGGFALQEQSAEGVGVAFAGATAGYGDGSSAFFNPAAMSNIEGTQFSFSGHVLNTSAKFSNKGSTTASGAPLTGGNGGDGGGTFFVPNIYAIHPLGDDVTFGLGINAPFGLETDYKDGWVGRYQALNSDLSIININPAISYQFNEQFSLGAALRFMYTDVSLTNAVDFGSIGVATLGLPTAAGLGLLPQAADGTAKVSGTDWATGFTLGGNVNYGENNQNNIGLSWRSRVNVNVNGDAEFNVPTNAQILTSTGAFTDTSAQAGLTLPEAVTAGWKHEINDDFTILGEVEWTRWSRFQELRVDFGGVMPDSVVEENWNDTWRVALGGIYHATEDLDVKAGWSFDQTPIPDAEHRTPRIPGNDRNWLSVGLGYQFTEAISANLSYAHIFVKSASSNTTGSTGDSFVGDWDSSVDIVSANIVWNIG